jgi:hypothetical protein
MDMNISMGSNESMLRPEHEPGELELLGCHHALTGVLNLVLQYGSNWRTTSEAEAEKYMKKVLGFGFKEAEMVRAATDQIEDASDAIQEVISHGLHVARKSGHHGEAYLRLYGVLNAAYLMTGALIVLANRFMSHEQGAFRERLRKEPLYELRNRMGAHSMDFGDGKDVYHRVVQMDMFRRDGKRSFVASDKGYQEIDVIKDIQSFERTSILILLELTEWKARCVIKRKSDHYTWMSERLEFVRTKADFLSS